MSGRNARLLFVLAAVLGGAALISAGDLRLPGNHRGFAPEQPIAFSHRLHAGELQITCLYCHSGAEKSRHAGIPEASVCMNCHTRVTARLDLVIEEAARAKAENREPRTIVAPELAKLYRALGLNDERVRDPGLEPKPIAWTRVHHLPDFVYFDHRPHVLRGVACETCHGPVQAMERVRQESDLSMGWCLACHRTQLVTPFPPPSTTTSTPTPTPTPTSEPGKAAGNESGSAAANSTGNGAAPAPVIPAVILAPPPQPQPVTTDCSACHF